MSALGELLTYIIYISLILSALTFLILIWYKRTFIRILLFSLSFVLLLIIWFTQHNNYNQLQADQAGIYYLTDFPNCKSCYIELKEDMTYEVINDNKISEKGNWHHQEGTDFDITYINKDEQLGYGRFAFKEFKLNNSKH